MTESRDFLLDPMSLRELGCWQKGFYDGADHARDRVQRWWYFRWYWWGKLTHTEGQGIPKWARWGRR